MHLTQAVTGQRVAAIVVAALAACAWSLLGPATHSEAQSDGCADEEGVTVVVDFQSLGRQTIIGCAAGPASSGFDALSQAGIGYQTVTSQPGFICRIQGLPADQTCADTPPANAYWSYWYADPGGEWTYARVGAGSRTPPPGSVEGWSFSTDPTARDGTPPRTAPPPASRPQPTPTPSATSTAPPPSLPDPTPTSTGNDQPPDPQPEPEPTPDSQPGPGPDPGPDLQSEQAARPDTTATPSRPVLTAEPTTQPTPDTSTPAPTETSSPNPLATMVAVNPDATGPSPIPSLTPGSDRTSEPLQVGGTSADGPPWQTLVGAGLVVTIGGAAGVVALRRRDG